MHEGDNTKVMIGYSLLKQYNNVSGVRGFYAVWAGAKRGRHSVIQKNIGDKSISLMHQ